GEGSPGKGSHSFAAQPPDLRHFALITRASRFTARSPCLAAPSIRFLFIGSQLTLHASFPRSVALTQLRFTSFAVINLWRDLHPQECAHAGRTIKNPCNLGFAGVGCMADRGGFEPPIRYERIHAFQACAFNHSATCPVFGSLCQLKAKRSPPFYQKWRTLAQGASGRTRPDGSGAA